MEEQKATRPYNSKSREEENLIRAAIADPRMFKPLYERYFKAVFIFVLNRTHEKEIAADITQQVFMNALSSLYRYQFRGFPFSSFLYRIAINQCNDYYRKTKRNRTVTLEAAAIENLVEELTIDQTMEAWSDALPHILRQLSVPELQMIELRFFEGRPFKEIAEILSISETYAKVKTYRILDKMKKIFLSNA